MRGVHFVLLASTSGPLLFRSFSSSARKMADLAAGKKAAAIKAIDDYVKVANFQLLFLQLLGRCIFAGQPETWGWKWQHYSICS